MFQPTALTDKFSYKACECASLQWSSISLQSHQIPSFPKWHWMEEKWAILTEPLSIYELNGEINDCWSLQSYFWHDLLHIYNGHSKPLVDLFIFYIWVFPLMYVLAACACLMPMVDIRFLTTVVKDNCELSCGC